MRYCKIICAMAVIAPALICAQTPVAPSGNPPGNAPAPKSMSRVTGIGGIFIKAKDPAKLQAWYKKHLGIDIQTWGGTAFRWVDDAGHATAGTTVWSVSDGKNFAPGKASFMVNYRVADLGRLLTQLRSEGCKVLDKTESSEYGKFGWVMDPEGNKIELWQPPKGQ